MTTQPETTPVATIGLHRTVAANIRGELAARYVSQQDIADLLGKKQQNVSQRLAGKTPFTLDEVGIIANYLGVDIADLFRARKNPRPVGPDGGSHGDATHHGNNGNTCRYSTRALAIVRSAA